jgi:hypothetical protein
VETLLVQQLTPHASLAIFHVPCQRCRISPSVQAMRPPTRAATGSPQARKCTQ